MPQPDEMPVPEKILSAKCHEPGGEVERSVYFMDFSIDNLQTLWEKSRHFHNIFGREVEGDFQKFCSLLMNGDGLNVLYSSGLFWRVDNFVGVFYMTRIVPEVDTVVHYIFFDKRHRGRLPLINAMLNWSFNTFQFNRMSVEIPAYASPNARILVEKHLGFKYEGKRREASQNRQGWHDIFLFGLLRKEFYKMHEEFQWVPSTEKQAAAQPSE